MVIQPTTIETSDGERLEAEWALPPTPTAGSNLAAPLAIVVTHPHPLHGGNMHAPVNAQLYRQAHSAGMPALRFNFRGAGQSSGSHDNGVAEQLDVAAAVQHLSNEQPNHRIVLAGWSFGADLALSCTATEVAGWFLVAPPLTFCDDASQDSATDPRPKHLLVPEQDQFNPPAKATAATEHWSGVTLTTAPGADHFLAGSNAVIAAAFESFLRQLS